MILIRFFLVSLPLCVCVCTNANTNQKKGNTRQNVTQNTPTICLITMPTTIKTGNKKGLTQNKIKRHTSIKKFPRIQMGTKFSSLDNDVHDERD